MARYLYMEEVPFKPQAFERAAESLESSKEDVKEIYKKGGLKALMEIPGVGKSIARHIEEYIKKGKIKDYENFKKRMPLKMDEMVRVEGLGPKKIKVLYKELGVHDLKTLEKAAKAGKVAPLFGFGETTEKNILQGLEFLKRDKGRFLISEILPIAREVKEKMEKFKGVDKVDIAGSLRRGKETIGDLDFLVIAEDSKRIMDFFVSLPGVEKVWGKGGTKASVRMRYGFDMDLRVIPNKSYGAALQYFTGSKEHNIITRKIAIEKGLKLSEYGLFHGSKMVASHTEEDIYKKLGMACPPPEIRENAGEVEAALKNELPKLIDLKYIKGDLHVHSNWQDTDGGKDSVEALAKYAISLGYEYIGISDHTKTLKIERSLNEKELLEQVEYIKKLNKSFQISNATFGSPSGSRKFQILAGCEANILKDGSIDIDDKVLEELDYVIAGVHSFLKMEKAEMMARIKKAMQNPNVDILAHPTGRVVGQRDEYAVDIDEILKIAKDTGTILEINSSSRLDLRDIYIRKAKNHGVKMIINTDAHKKEQMNLMEYGILQARRGWAEKGDIINTLPIEELLRHF